MYQRLAVLDPIAPTKGFKAFKGANRAKKASRFLRAGLNSDRIINVVKRHYGGKDYIIVNYFLRTPSICS